jgi:adenylylsulfate reductase, subunit B
MPPVIVKEKCNACGICAEYCPTGVFKIADAGKAPEVYYPEECWHCNACVLDCKQKAVNLRIPLPAMMLYIEAEKTRSE